MLITLELSVLVLNVELISKKLLNIDDVFIVDVINDTILIFFELIVLAVSVELPVK
jgi:hypothetical protein